MLASLLLFTGCANYLDQDPEDLNSMDKIFSSKIETTKWYNRIYSDDFMVQEMHYSGQIPYFWCTDESAYILESHVRNIAEGKMSPDNYYGYTGSYNLYFFVHPGSVRQRGGVSGPGVRPDSRPADAPAEDVSGIMMQNEPRCMQMHRGFCGIKSAMCTKNMRREPVFP